MSVTNLVNLSSAVNKLYAATQEKGYNSVKETLLTGAKTALATAITSDTALTGTVALASAASAIDSIAWAIEAGNNHGNGSGGAVLTRKVLHEPKHTADAYASALSALTTPSV